MAYKPPSFITSPEEEEQDYLEANSPSVPKYVAAPDVGDAPDPSTVAFGQQPSYVSSDPNDPYLQASRSPAQFVSPGGPAPSPMAGYQDPASFEEANPNQPAPTKPKTAADLRLEEEQLAGQRPSDKPPGFWRTLGGIGAGIGVGYLTRNPNMVAQVQGQIMHPNAAKVQQWAAQMNDKATQAEQQEKIDADARAATLGDANLAQVTAETRKANAEAAVKEGPGTPPSPEFEYHDGLIINKRTGEVKPSAVAPTVKPALGDADTQLGIAAWKRIPGNEGKDPTLDDLATIKGTFRADPKDPALSDAALKVRAAGGTTGIPTVDSLTPAQAKAALNAGKEPKQQSDTAQKDQAINAAFQSAGGDWNKVLDNARAGKYTAYAGDIADHAQKMTALKPDAQRKVVAADTTAQQVQAAIDGIDEVVKNHPELVGDAGHHPINALTRKWETNVGSEPSDVGVVDSVLETAAALQPGQHNFRSIGALAEFKKALGIDPRTGKADGSRAWLANPEKAKAALKAVADFNSRLKENTLNEAGQGGRAQAAPSAVGGGKIVVTAPDGSQHQFDTPAQAEAFKKLAHIQ